MWIRPDKIVLALVLVLVLDSLAYWPKSTGWRSISAAATDAGLMREQAFQTSTKGLSIRSDGYQA